jgi:cytochrome P450
MRRNAFSRVFTQTALRRRSEEIDALVEKLVLKLRQYEAQAETVPIDRLFGQLTVDVISEIGFSYKIGALDDSGSSFYRITY